MNILRVIFILLVMSFASGCAVIKTTGGVVGAAAKVAAGTVKVTGKVIGATAMMTAKGVKTVVNMAAGKHVVSLAKEGNSLLVDALLNRKIKTRLILDTGCSDTQISREVARKLGIKTSGARTVLCQLANGGCVSGREVNIKEIRVGRVKIYNVKAVVLDSDLGGNNGLLGMSFLNNFIFRVDSEKRELVLQRRI
ncbi:MAG: retropepsin-like aspartic protease [Candidatus Omnitrophota bacterium]